MPLHSLKRPDPWIRSMRSPKRLADPYYPRTRWLKIKNPDYSQQEGRGELFNRVR